MANIQYQEPFKAFRFLVEVEGSAGAVVAAFSQISGIKMQTQAIPVRHGAENRGVTEFIPALTSYQNVTLTKGVIGDNEFFDWILSCAPDAAAAPTGKEQYRTINIVALDEKGNRSITWSLIGAMPVGYELSPMDSSQSAIMTETLEFTITGFKRITQPPAQGSQQ